jgi:histidinol dehydrogenase
MKIYELATIKSKDLKQIFYRAQASIDAVREDVIKIIERVRKDGDQALVELTKELDDPSYSKSQLVVSEADYQRAYRVTPAQSVLRIKEQISLSKKFHAAQREQMRNWETEIAPGVIGGEKWTAIDRVGLYVPGGKNPFPTVQQILAVPALAAQCPSIASCVSPRGEINEVLIAAKEAGIKELYRVSGPQAIAAMAFGTESIAPVELIAGPGNPYVTAAKILCQEKIAIDMPAGPSEAIILADGSASPEMTLERKAVFCAADILARAEHGPDSAGVLVTDSMRLAELTAVEVDKQRTTLSRAAYIDKALEMFSAILVTSNMEEAISFTNDYAPEHLEILTNNPRETMKSIRNAGSIFLGNFNPVATGDYAIGVNHVLPTGTWAKRTSAVGVWTFMKRVQFSEVTPAGLKSLQPIVQTISDIEGLDAHKRSVDVRFE